MKRRYLFIVNPMAAAGRAGRAWASLGVPPGLQATSRVVFTTGPGHAQAVAQEGAPEVDVVVAVGGDGTANEVASGILRSSRPGCGLAVLPVGTGNDLARALGATDVQSVLCALPNGAVRPMDVIDVVLKVGMQRQHRVALVFAAAGCGAELLRHTTPTVKRVFGPRWAYLVGLLRALRHFRAQWMEVRWDDEACSEELLMVAIGNAEAAGGGAFRLFPGASLTDGLLEVVQVRRLALPAVLGQLPRLTTGAYIRHRSVRYRRAARLELSGESPVPVQIDGELSGETPASFRVRPAALHVCFGARP